MTEIGYFRGIYSMTTSVQDFNQPMIIVAVW